MNQVDVVRNDVNEALAAGNRVASSAGPSTARSFVFRAMARKAAKIASLSSLLMVNWSFMARPCTPLV